MEPPVRPQARPPERLLWDQSSLQPGAAGPAAALGGATGAARMLVMPGMDKRRAGAGRDARGAWRG